MTSSSATEVSVPVATIHAQAAELLRRPFASGAIGFRAMMKAPYNGDPLAARSSPPTSAPNPFYGG